MKLTMKDFGSNGRLANQLFQYASLLGIANKDKLDLVLPSWKYSDYFTGKFPVNEEILEYVTKEEKQFHYKEINTHYIDDLNINLKGYYQSKKYWENYETFIEKHLTFTTDFIYETNNKFESINGKILEYPDQRKPLIGIHIRRGDYVNNPNYYQLPIHYYIQALRKHFDKYESDYNIIFFSDDIEYCKLHFSCLHNAYFSEGNSDIEDLCLISQCDNLILSNSSYSWWGAYLSNADKIIRPNYLFDGELKEKNDDKDFWNINWTIFDHINNKIHLNDVTFTIPVNYDHNDRKENLNLCINTLNKDFYTNIMVMEQGGNKFNYYQDSIANVMYLLFHNKEFHRTKMLNEMALKSITSIIANWDADVFIPPMQILKAVQQIRDGNDMVYPYDGNFVRMNRQKNYDILNQTKDIGNYKSMEDNNHQMKDRIKNIGITKSVGGAIFFNKESFIKGGMENENFISFGAEDFERYDRFTKLGFKVSRVLGNLYHLNHFVGVNSSKDNFYFNWNEIEYIKVKLMDKEELLNYIKTWKWMKKLM